MKIGNQQSAMAMRQSRPVQQTKKSPSPQQAAPQQVKKSSFRPRNDSAQISSLSRVAARKPKAQGAMQAKGSSAPASAAKKSTAAPVRSSQVRSSRPPVPTPQASAGRQPKASITPQFSERSGVSFGTKG